DDEARRVIRDAAAVAHAIGVTVRRIADDGHVAELHRGRGSEHAERIDAATVAVGRVAADRAVGDRHGSVEYPDAPAGALRAAAGGGGLRPVPADRTQLYRQR